MPRSLARLRYKAPPKPISFATPPPHGSSFSQTVARFVRRQSSPPLLRLQTVVNSRAHRPPTGQHAKPPTRPSTLRDLVDPKATASHGEIIYVFRNIATNQVLYSLQELLAAHHLRQLPFIGKHSTPPSLRPDEWVPHCVVCFPSPAQGHSAFRRLREFRTLHELAWPKTNPEYKQLTHRARARAIMDQRANFSADLAEVLRMQADYGARMQEERTLLDRQATEYRAKRWQEIEQLAQAAQDKLKLADSVTWLQGQVDSIGRKLRMEHNQNDADQKRLKAAKESLQTRLRRVKYAVRKAQQLKQARADLTARAAPAADVNAQERLRSFKAQAHQLQDALENPDPTRSISELDSDRDTLAQLTAQIDSLTSAFEAQAQLASDTHPTSLSVLPRYFTKNTAQPFTLEGVRVAWADLQDALYAKGQWPDAIEHQSLDLNASRASVALLSKEEYSVEVKNDMSRIFGVLEAQRKPQQLHEAMA